LHLLLGFLSQRLVPLQVILAMIEELVLVLVLPQSASQRPERISNKCTAEDADTLGANAIKKTATDQTPLKGEGNHACIGYLSLFRGVPRTFVDVHAEKGFEPQRVPSGNDGRPTSPQAFQAVNV
jgi:hypothetical protein